MSTDNKPAFEAGVDHDRSGVEFVSIAISLKRIADALSTPNEYGEVGTAAFSGAILRGLRNQ